jgi:ribosomal protein S18 acetylase RimI-like enzyme
MRIKNFGNSFKRVKDKETMEMRFARQKDAPALASLDKQAHSEMSYWKPQSTRTFQATIKTCPHSISVALINKQAVGYLEVQQGKKITVENIYVLQQWRRKNIARALMEHSLSFWKNKSESITLLAADRNVKIFEKLGFRKTMNYMEYVNQ